MPPRVATIDKVVSAVGTTNARTGKATVLLQPWNRTDVQAAVFGVVVLCGVCGTVAALLAPAPAR